MSDDQIIAFRRGEPVSVTGYVTSLNCESDGPPPLLVRMNECANPLNYPRYFEIWLLLSQSPPKVPEVDVENSTQHLADFSEFMAGKHH